MRTVPEVRELTDELVAIGQVENSEGKVLIDTGAQVSLIKKGASTVKLAKPDVILKGISGKTLKTYGRQRVALNLKPGIKVTGDFVVGNLPRGYLAVLGCDILGKGNGEISVERGVLRLFGKEIWLNRIRKGESVPDPNRPSTSAAPKMSPRFVYCCSDVKIPPRCEKIIQVKTSRLTRGSEELEGTEVVIEPNDFIMHGVYLARTLTKVEKNRCWVKTINVSAEELTLPKNLKLGTLDSDLAFSKEVGPVRQKLLILADSHGRGLQEILSERLPRSIEVEVFFMPNGKLKHVTSKLKSFANSLNENDTVVIIGGTNDIDKAAPYPLTLQQAFVALPKELKAKTTVLSIFDRYDTDLKSELSDANGLLKAIIQNLDQQYQGEIAFLDVKGEFNRRLYTKHGLHLNEQGKLTLASILRKVVLRNFVKPQARVGMVSRADNADLEACLDEKLKHLPSRERDLVKSTLLEFRSVLAHSDDQPLGCTSAVKHVIRTGDAAPIYKKAYRVPYHQKAALDSLVKDQLDKGIIVPSQSEWASAVVLVPKKSPDGTPKLRFCVDYRGLNALTTPDVYPLPNITETLDSLGGCQVFTTLDLRSGYHQIQVDEESRPKTAFNVPGGHYEYQRMPFGLNTAPATFQRLMDSVLMGLKGEKCLVYLDDIILFSKDLPSHLEAIREVLTKLQGVNLAVQLSKCNFVVDEVNYLGHVITKKGIEPDPSKIKAVRDFPIPTNIKEVRSFLGLAGYYRRFIDGFATIGRPLFDVTKQGQEFLWTPQCQEAFDELKQKLVTAPVLIYPDFSKPFILATDASTYALGAVLSQEVDGQEHPVAYCSRTLFPAEKNYSTTERELLSLVWSTKYFRCYLLGRPFKVITDHAALKWMLSLKDPSSRLMRWSLRLAEFDFTVEHKAGKRHTNADGLSRAVHVVRSDALPVVDLDILRKCQREDPVVQGLKQAKRFRMSPEKILYRLSSGEKKIVVPASLVPEVIRLNHDLPTAGHAGVAKTLDRVRQKFWWKCMDKDVMDYVRTCRSCSQRTNHGKTKAPLGEVFNEPLKPFEVIAMDVVGPLPISESRNVYILSVMDHFSRYCEFIPLPDQTAESVARALVQRVITKFGVPRSLVTDQGSNFTSDLIKHLCKFLHVRKVQTTGFHPQSNGRLERVHATVVRMLSHFVNRNQTNWDEYLPYVTMAYNSQTHESTGYSPYELVFGRKMEMPMEADLAITDETEIFDNHIEALREKLQEAYEVTARRKTLARGRNERQYNAKAKAVEYQAGQLVWLHVPSIGRHRVKKLSKLWKGPYQIVRVISPQNVVIRIRKREVVVHVNRIKPCRERPRPSAEPQGKQGKQRPCAVDRKDQGSEDLAQTVEDSREADQGGAPVTPVAEPGPSGAMRPKRNRREPERWGEFIRFLRSFMVADK